MLIANSDDSLKNFGMRCSKRLADGDFIFHAHQFWTLPYPYYLMLDKAPDLFNDLSLSSLIILKGDLHYRKLVALRGFAPAPLLVLRTLKAETQAGLSSTVIDELRKKYGTSKSWMVVGEYGVAQFADVN
ncbi:unnamed protein product [Gongylonema pulchrum]|uniref:Sugar phosphate phosphatase n=1 Tax=Gongylonema pulchrum TaxID=637853 RepID=A0A183E3D7_9BILA|nr:unnamed protein product [Gongylonema pulchrum]